MKKVWMWLIWRLILLENHNLFFVSKINFSFPVSLNGGVYLPATYQSLLLCFAILIQLVIGVQWLVSDPADVVVKHAKETINVIGNNISTVAPSVNTTEYLGYVWYF